ncbi:MAG: DUF1287 domain-containing protein [Lactobacillaceae bacterium]|jgi:uncharacterized protein YijF (DUF1287 family)|nr:DUF1287 domain-containing protein [Lactobacillaceae bacterium]
MKLLKLAFLLFLIAPTAFAETEDNFYLKLANATKELKTLVIYDSSYTKIAYPNGDVNERKGVCTDVVIRTYRKLGIDLQQKVHEDMKKNFEKYPRIWGLKKPDANIDHRRVPNLQVFFSRYGETLPISDNPKDYKAGDIVTWDVGNNTPHIGIVINEKSQDDKRPLIFHNIGFGQVKEDCLFNYKITGHYRYK